MDPRLKAEPDWAECVVAFSDEKASTDASEVWVFRKRDYGEFQRLIGLRLSYRRPTAAAGNAGEPEGAPMRFGEARRAEAMASTRVTCRDRSVDPEIRCAECVRVFTGGAYRDKAISVPAFPSQPTILGCLALSLGESAPGAAEQDTPKRVEAWHQDGEEGARSAVAAPPLVELPLRQTAFCNSVNARFSTVPSG